MAVRSEYVSTAIDADKLEMAALVNGAKSVTMIQSTEIAAADDDASVLAFFKGLNGNLIITDIRVYCDAITGFSDADLGLYEQGVKGSTGPGAVISKDVFMDGQSLATAISRGGGTGNQDEAIDGMANVDIADLRKKIYEHAGHTVKNSKDGYDICLTANTIGSGTGTVTIILDAVIGS